MGLFPDSAYDPNTFQSPQGGLLDRLLAQVNAAPTTPGPGFPGAPTPAAAPPVVAQDDEDTPAPASPINVGGYQMPRIGDAAGFTLPPGQLDPNTGEHVVAPAAPAAPAALPAAPFNAAGDHLKAAWQSMRHGGGLIGGLSGLVTGQRDDPQNDVQQQQQAVLQRQYTALVNAGVPHQQAMIAVLNPEAGKKIIEQTFGPPQVAPQYAWDPKTGKAVHLYEPEQKDNFQVVQTGEDGLGKKTFSKMNKADGTMTPIALAPGTDANSSGLGDTSKTGDAYLATLPPQLAGDVKAMAEGRLPPPSGYAMAKPYWQSRVQAAEAYDPTFDASKWSGRVAGVRDFSAGKSSEMVRSANQTLQHVNALIDSADALHNGNYPSVNWAGNKLAEATGAGEPGAFLTNAHAVADEMGKVFKGANLSDSEIHAWADALSPNMSPTQQRAQIGKMTELLHGALDALDEKRVSSIGQVAADKAGPIIKPAGQAVLQRIETWLKAGGGASGSANGGTAPTGVKWSVVQ